MSNLSTQMVVLMRSIARDARERQKTISAIKNDTASMLLAFDHERIAMAAALKSSLTSDRASRSAEVLEIRDNASKISMDFRLDHARMGQSLRQSLVETKQSVVGAVSSLRTEFFKERADFSKSHRHMSRLQRKALLKDRVERSSMVAELMNTFTKAHQQMAAVQRQELFKGRQARTHDVLTLIRSFYADTAAKPASVFVPSAPVQELTPAAAETSVKEPLSTFNWSHAMQDKPAVLAVVSPPKAPSSYVKQVAEAVGAPKNARMLDLASVAVSRPVPAKAGKSKKK